MHNKTKIEDVADVAAIYNSLDRVFYDPAEKEMYHDAVHNMKRIQGCYTTNVCNFKKGNLQSLIEKNA